MNHAILHKIATRDSRKPKKTKYVVRYLGGTIIRKAAKCEARA